ncbi:MAG: SRPBCC family protein [Fluviibacter sp.]
MSQCQAYRLLTDYDSVEDIPGFVYSNTERISANKVQVERMVEEKILFFPIDVRSTNEFTELPYTGTDFKQIQGKAKTYQGNWRIKSEGSKSTRFHYQAYIQPGSYIPSFLIQHFISKKLRRNFEALINVGLERQNSAFVPCN